MLALALKFKEKYPRISKETRFLKLKYKTTIHNILYVAHKQSHLAEGILI